MTGKPDVHWAKTTDTDFSIQSPEAFKYNGLNTIRVSVNGGDPIIVKPGDIIAKPGDRVVILASVPEPSEAGP